MIKWCSVVTRQLVFYGCQIYNIISVVLKGENYLFEFNYSYELCWKLKQHCGQNNFKLKHKLLLCTISKQPKRTRSIGLLRMKQIPRSKHFPLFVEVLIGLQYSIHFAMLLFLIIILSRTRTHMEPSTMQAGQEVPASYGTRMLFHCRVHKCPPLVGIPSRVISSRVVCARSIFILSSSLRIGFPHSLITSGF